MPEVSVIIPVYNTEKYLRKCLESVRNQTLKDIEIICVDDGSTDSCPDILDEYARMDARIKVIHKKNGGLVSARKTGIAAATAACAGYVDSDDWIEPDMYEKLYFHMRKEQAELVTCGYYLEGDYTTEHLDTVDEGLYGKGNIKYLRDNVIYRMECRETGLRGGLWCKLFSTRLQKRVQSMIPDEISIAEDKVCLLRYILECSSVYVLKKPLYHWVIRQESMSRESKGQGNDYLVRINHVYNYLMSLYEHPHFTDVMRLQAEIYMTELIFLGVNKRMGFQNRNLIWIDPYWLEQIPPHAKIILYGAGETGEKYKKQLCKRPDIELTAVADDGGAGYLPDGAEVIPPERIDEFPYDYIVITVKNKGKAGKMKDRLKRMGIADEAVIWCEQPEVYWRFVEAEICTDACGAMESKKNEAD